MHRFVLLLGAAGSLVFGSLGGIMSVQGGADKCPIVHRSDPDDLKGEIKTIDFDSKHLGEPREVKVYLPPGHDPKKSYPVVYSVDSFDGVACDLIEPLIISGKVPPLIIVGTACGPGRTRQADYMPQVDPEHFALHEKFFIEEVIPWAEKEFGASRKRMQRALRGSSNGGPFALTMANRYSKLFGHVFAMMVYGLKFDDFEDGLKAQPKNPTRYILVVGSEDEHGIEENQKVEEILKKKKFPVASVIIEGAGHTGRFCQEQLPACVEAAFGKSKKYQPTGQVTDKPSAH